MTSAESPSPGQKCPRNPATRLDPTTFESVAINATAAERRTSSLTARRSVKKQFQAAGLVQALTRIDLTTLSGDDTPARVQRLCARAEAPLGDELLAALRQQENPPKVGADEIDNVNLALWPFPACAFAPTGASFDKLRTRGMGCATPS